MIRMNIIIDPEMDRDMLICSGMSQDRSVGLSFDKLDGIRGVQFESVAVLAKPGRLTQHVKNEMETHRDASNFATELYP